MSKIINNTLVYKKVIQGEPNELTIEPSKEEQVYTPSENELLTQVTVKGYTPQVEDLTITPTTSEQVFEVPSDKDGYGKVTVEPFSGEFEPKFQQLINGTLTEVTAEDLQGATKVNAYAFYNQKNLHTINLPSSVTSIGTHAFDECDSLVSVKLDYVKSLGNQAFANCDNLKNVDMRSVTSLDAAFYRCTNIANVKFDSVENVGADTFYGAFLGKNDIVLPSLKTLHNNFAYQMACTKKVVLGKAQNVGFNRNTLHILALGGEGICVLTVAPLSLDELYVRTNLIEQYKVATNWVKYADITYPYLDTISEIENVDTTKYVKIYVFENNSTYTYTNGEWVKES